MFVGDAEVGEITSTPARDEDLPADLLVSFEHEDSTASSARDSSAHQARRASTDDENIPFRVMLSSSHE